MRTPHRTIAIVCITFLCLSLVAHGEEKKTYPPQPRITGLNIGDAAPDFKLPGIDGKDHTLAEFGKADVLAVLFTCNHCPTSQAYEDEVIQMVRHYADARKSFALVAISSNDPGALRPDEEAYSDVGDSLEDMKVRAKRKKFNFPYLYDGQTQRAGISYGAVATPHIFIFDKARKLRYVGAIGDRRRTPHARNAIDALLAGKPVPVETSRPFGCSTKWAYKRRGVDQQTAAWNARAVTLERIDAAGVKALAGNDAGVLRLICVWSLADASCKAGLGELVRLRRIYERRGFELITLNCDGVAKQADVLALLEKHHAASPGRPGGKPRAVNYIFSGADNAGLLAALGQEKKTTAPCCILVAPGGKVLHTQTVKLDAAALREQVVKFFQRR